MKAKDTVHFIMIIVFTGCLFLFLEVQDLYASLLTLDTETVFCLYYKLSGEDMKEEDLEDLSFELGRPAYTAHKPSEMFMKGNLRALKARLLKKVKECEESALYRWDTKCMIIPIDMKNKYHKVFLDHMGMPRSTPYICSAMSKTSRAIINKRVLSISSKRPHIDPKKPFDLTIYLQPEKVDYKYQKRNIAQENVLLPIRYVIFKPVKIEIFDETVIIQK